MMRAGVVLLLISPLAIAADGSWSNQSFGGTLTRGQQVLKSKPVQSASPLPAGVVASRIHWKIATHGLTPPGFAFACAARHAACRCPVFPASSVCLPVCQQAGRFVSSIILSRAGVLTPR